MPGTVGSFVATLIAAALPCSQILYLTVALALFMIGTWSCDQYIVKHKYETDRDPGYIVIDEACGIFCGYSIIYPLAVSLGVSPIATLLINFLLFRLFDITKPFPIKMLEKKLESNDNTVGIGIMLDDVLAAVYAALSHVVLLMLWAG
jgi:phosphatidylglycerophosphatase A